MGRAERGDDVARLVRSAGLHGFPYLAFGNRPARPAPEAELPEPLAAEMPAEPRTTAADGPAYALPVSPADALPASPVPEPVPTPPPVAPSFSLLRQVTADAANPAAYPAPRVRPAPFTLLPKPVAPAGP